MAINREFLFKTVNELKRNPDAYELIPKRTRGSTKNDAKMCRWRQSSNTADLRFIFNPATVQLMRTTNGHVDLRRDGVFLAVLPAKDEDEGRKLSGVDGRSKSLTIPWTKLGLLQGPTDKKQGELECDVLDGILLINFTSLLNI